MTDKPVISKVMKHYRIQIPKKYHDLFEIGDFVMIIPVTFREKEEAKE